MLAAEPTILFHFESVGVVFLVFNGVIVSLFAFAANECYFYSHNGTSTIEFFSAVKTALPPSRKALFPSGNR